MGARNSIRARPDAPHSIAVSIVFVPARVVEWWATAHLSASTQILAAAHRHTHRDTSSATIGIGIVPTRFANPLAADPLSLSLCTNLVEVHVH